jgi:hypothetical protein
VNPLDSMVYTSSWTNVTCIQQFDLDFNFKQCLPIERTLDEVQVFALVHPPRMHILYVSAHVCVYVRACFETLNAN